jgi:hypothetical protein
LGKQPLREAAVWQAIWRVEVALPEEFVQLLRLHLLLPQRLQSPKQPPLARLEVLLAISL